MKKILCIVLALCMILSCVLSTGFVAFAATADSYVTSASTGPQVTIQGGAILHCFNWSYNNIKKNLQAIRDAGYTAVQTSPVQSPKDYNPSWNDQGGQWWKLYQPLDFKISNNTWLGTKSDLKSLCDAAESMGIKVVVDVVANHLSGNTGGGGYGALDGNVDSTLKKKEYFHDYNNRATDNNRYEMTMGHIGMPDLNTGHADIQRFVKDFLVECVNVGVDGFRFDAAKHIELPTDDRNSSDFWPTVINGSQSASSKELFYYGEILNGCGTNIGNYTKYMSITDNNSSDSILMAACNGNAQGMANSYLSKGAAPNKSVLWVESHDTYMGHSGSAGMGNTSGVSDDKIIKAWAMVGSRADAASLFFARSAANMGSASTNTTWKSKPVAEVNKFKNYFDGQTESLSSEGSIAYNERGTSGVVLVNAGGTSCSVNVKANKMANGTYTDAVSGGKFTVSNGRITGNIGNTGVAVVYNPSNDPTPQPTVTPTQKPTETPTQPHEQYLVGDIDLDGDITILDATAIQKHLSDLITLNSKSLRAADIDLDGSKDVTDATLIQLYLVGIVPNDTYCGKYVTGGDIVDPTDTLNPLPAGNYVYFNNINSWSDVYIYYWSDNNTGVTSWPGVKMSKYEGSVYYVEVPEGIGYVIFNNGSSQTSNIAFAGFNKIFDNGSWKDFIVTPTTAPTNSPQPTSAPIADSNYIYFKNNDNWGEVKVYYWSDSNSNMTDWPGQHMEYIGNNVYKAEIPGDASMIVFNNNNQGLQTPDIRLEGFGKIYDNGSWSVYND